MPREVADAVAVGVREAARVDLVDDGALPPGLLGVVGQVLGIFQSFTAPAAMPAMNCRWPMTIDHEDRDDRDHGGREDQPPLVACWPWNAAIAIGSVRFSGSSMTVRAQTNSSHAPRKVKIAAVASAGRDQRQVEAGRTCAPARRRRSSSPRPARCGTRSKNAAQQERRERDGAAGVEQHQPVQRVQQAEIRARMNCGTIMMIAGIIRPPSSSGERGPLAGEVEARERVGHHRAEQQHDERRGHGDVQRVEEVAPEVVRCPAPSRSSRSSGPRGSAAAGSRARNACDLNDVPAM